MPSLKAPIRPNATLARRPGVAEPGTPFVKTWTTSKTWASPLVCILCLNRVHLLTFHRRAVWISPVNQNYDGPRTPYGDAYHGYWIADLSQLNDHFGTADDLKALSDELHKRGM